MNANSNWTEVASVLLAFLALMVSALSFFNSRRALRLARLQDERRKPLFVAALLNSYVEFPREGRARFYGFELSISNPSDSDNSVAKAELHITYTTSTNAQITVRLQASPARGEAFSGLSDFSFLSTPLRLDTHQTLRGWFVFRVPKDVLAGVDIQKYSITLVDSHGLDTEVEPVMVPEYVNAALSS